MTDPATAMLPGVDPGPGWFAPPIPAEQHPVTVDSPTTQIAVVDRPSPSPQPAEPATVRPYVDEPVDIVDPVDDTPPPRVELGPLQVDIVSIHPAVLADLAEAVRGLLYPPAPDGDWPRHAQHHAAADLFEPPDLPAGRLPLPPAGGDTSGWLMCPTPGCAQRAGHAGPCDRAAADTGQED